MTSFNRVGTSLAVFFFIFLASPFLIPVAAAGLPSLSSATALGTTPPKSTTPYDGTISFKGEWAWKLRPETPPYEFVTRKEGGAAVFQLTFSPSQKQRMYNVHGNLMLRNGNYLTDYDSTMLLQGVYMEDLGRLSAIAQPLTAVEVPKSNSTNNSTNGTLATGSTSGTSGAREESEGIVAQSAALRKAAELLLSMSETEAEAMLNRAEGKGEKDTLRSIIPGTTNSACRFFLELHFKPGKNTTTPTTTPTTVEAAAVETRNSGDEVHHAASPPILSPEAIASSFTSSSSSTTPPTSKSLPLSLISVSGQLRALQCGFSMDISAAPADTAAYTAKATHYSMIISLVGLFQIALTMRQLEASSSITAASQLSLITIGYQAVQDAFLCLMHLTTAIMVDPLFNSFATAACVQFCLFGIFELRLLLITWRARRRGAVDPWVIHREVTSFYARFYGAVLGTLVLCYTFRRYMRVVTIILHGYWIPQIVQSAKTDQKPPLLASYIIGMSVARLVLPLYMFACPSNLLKVAPSLGICVGLVLFIVTQAGVLLLQRLSGPRFGPRWCIPRKFLPAKYDYYRQCTKHKGDIETGEAEDCVICMNPMVEGTGEGDAGSMIAPCDHRFHSNCLQRWMAVKLECPTCRRPLPPP
jgi:hypothetical protein